MQAAQIELEDFGPRHLDAALALSQAERWPHRRQDWADVAALSHGTVAIEGERVVGTALTTPFGTAAATINMVIVAESMRGRGLGRRLMARALEKAGPRECRLVATADGLPLYERLGFQARSEIRQHQGVVGTEHADTPSLDVSWLELGEAGAADHAALAAMDARACGMDRGALFALLAARGRFAAIRRAGAIEAFACLRLFGRGEIAGPVVAGSARDARALLAFLFASRPGAFLRVDVPAASGLSPWLAAQGLDHVGGGIAMARGAPAPREPDAFHTFALASQALG